MKLVQRRNQKESWRFIFEIYKVSKTIRFEWRKIFGTGLSSNCFWALPCTGCSKFSRFEVFGGCSSFCHLIPPKCYHWDVLTLMSCSYSCGGNNEHLMKSFKCAWFIDASLSLHIFTDWHIVLIQKNYKTSRLNWDILLQILKSKCIPLLFWFFLY